MRRGRGWGAQAGILFLLLLAVVVVSAAEFQMVVAVWCWICVDFRHDCAVRELMRRATTT
jgi:hypothetical protein